MWHGRVSVDPVDHRRQRGALAGAGRADDEHEAVRLVEQVGARPRRAELLERADAEGDDAQRERERAALLEGVGAEAADAGEAEREVDLVGARASSCC